MCRILVQIGKPLKKSVYKDFLDTCADYPEGLKKDLHEHNQDKSYNHADGFGYAFYERGHLSTRCFVEPIFQNAPIYEWINLHSKFLLLHARRASPGNEVNLRNNHPFYWHNNNKEFVFAHNGTIKSQIENYDEEVFSPEGSTDSELFFYSLLTGMKKNNWTLSRKIVEATLNGWDYSGANFVLASPEKVWVGVFNKSHPNYYKMKLYESSTALVISSSLLPTLGKPTKIIENEVLMEIDLKSKNVKFD